MARVENDNSSANSDILKAALGLSSKVLSGDNSMTAVFDTEFDDAQDLSTSGVLDPMTSLLLYLKAHMGGTADMQAQFAQLLLQYYTGEQNYQRSLASNQVAQMMSAGMSRAAALQALHGGSDSQTAISPMATNAEETRTNRINSILNGVQTATQVANQIVSLISAPFDIKAKSVTNDILTNQANMLGMQVQGMQDAAAFLQASANQRNFDPAFSDMKLSDQIDYFSKMSGADYKSDYNMPSYAYANSEQFKRCMSNPYFWATLHNSYSNASAADASFYEPAKAEQEVSRLRAAVALTNNQAWSERQRSRILSSDAFVAEYTQAIKSEMEYAKLQAEKHGYEFDDKKSQAFLERVQDFTDLDFARLDYEIERISRMNNPLLMDKQIDALTSSLDFQVANYIYSQSLLSIKNGALESLYSTDDAGNRVPSQDLYNWCKVALQYNELGYNTYETTKQGWWRTAFSGLTAGAASALAGLKIVQAVKDAAPAVQAAVQSVKPPIPFNALAPIVVPTATMPMLQPGYGWYPDGGMQ